MSEAFLKGKDRIMITLGDAEDIIDVASYSNIRANP
jgi:hypothetical protein